MSNQKYHHYVPQTYLKKWLNDKNQVFLYGKDNKVRKICKTDKILGINNFYTKEDIVIFSNDEKKEMFKCLEGYRVICEEREIESINELARKYHLFDEWIIKNKERGIASKKRLKREIEKVRILKVENLLGDIEKDWNEISGEIKEFSKFSDCEKINNEILDKIKKFAFIQESRTPRQLKKIEERLESRIGFLKDEMKECYDIIKSEFPKPLFLSNLQKILEGKSKGIYEDRYNAFRKSSLKIIQATGNKKYLTNDNPVNSLECKNGIETIYFVISPEILCFFILDGKEEFSFEQMPVNTIRRFNKRIREDAVEFYVSSAERKSENELTRN